jgi:ribosomal protein S4E
MEDVVNITTMEKYYQLVLDVDMKLIMEKSNILEDNVYLLIIITLETVEKS